MAGQWVYSIPNPQSTYNINIRQNWMIAVFRHLMILSRKTDTIELCLMLTTSDAENRNYWILSDVNIIRCSKKRQHEISSDVNIIRSIRRNSMIAVFLYNMIWTSDKFNDVCFSTSDDINIRQNSIISVFLHLMILTSEKSQWKLFFGIWWY